MNNMGSIQEKFFKTLNDEEFLNHIDRFIDYFVQLDQDTKNKYMYQFNFFGPELKRRGL